jgi:hypothetical protein
MSNITKARRFFREREDIFAVHVFISLFAIFPLPLLHCTVTVKSLSAGQRLSNVDDN